MEAVKTLIAQRDAIELEIDSLREWLQAPGRPGLKGGLVDKDGFPLEDVDLVIKTREARHRLACTTTFQFLTHSPLFRLADRPYQLDEAD